MNDFLTDLWADLRAKRLWPVALVLAAALVAVPFVLLKPAADEAAPSAALVRGANAAPPASLVTATETRKGGSALGVFREQDPFEGKADPAESDDAPGGDAGSASSGSGSGSASLTASAGVSSSGAGTAPPTGGSGGGSGTTGGGSGGTQLYTYTVDVRFGRTGSERSYGNVKRLALLPNDSNPMLVYLGASVSGKEAVFLVDAGLSQAGEGECKPSTDTCSFLYLSADPGSDEHDFADAQGREYHLQLVRIEQKTVSASVKSSRKRGTRAKRATARKSAREFLFRPFLLDARRR